jgi:hypothetical protein
MTAPSPGLPTCCALWIGPGLGPVERGCLASFVAVGHPVRLYTYGEPGEVPAGVEVVDGSRVLPGDEIDRLRKNGSPALFSDWFRFELMRTGAGVWIDCDVVCVRPLPDDPVIVGWQDEKRINSAVLRLPPTHPAIPELLSIFTSPTWVPPWEGALTRAWLRAKRRFLPGFGLVDLPWGVTGPTALTWVLPRCGVREEVAARDVYYPVRLRDAGAFLTTERDAVARHVTARTRCIHLWNQAVKESCARPPPRSFLAAVADGTWRERLPEVSGTRGSA